MYLRVVGKAWVKTLAVYNSGSSGNPVMVGPTVTFT